MNEFFLKRTKSPLKQKLKLVSRLNFFIGFTIQAILIYMNKESALYYYGFGYMIYALLVTLSYYIYFLTRKKEERQRLFLISSFSDLMIKPTAPYVDHALFNETKTFFWQGILMKILTEGEKYAMTIFNLVSYKDQGIYDLVNNLGSLLPRLIFSTLEDSAYSYFQQTLSRTTTTTHDQHVQDDQMLTIARKDEQDNKQQQQTGSTGRSLRRHRICKLLILTSLATTQSLRAR